MSNVAHWLSLERTTKTNLKSKRAWLTTLALLTWKHRAGPSSATPYRRQPEQDCQHKSWALTFDRIKLVGIKRLGMKSFNKSCILILMDSSLKLVEEHPRCFHVVIRLSNANI